MSSVSKEEFKSLAYGKMILTKSHQSRVKHFTFVISDQPHKMIAKSSCKPLHLGLTISSKDSKSDNCMKINAEDLPVEVQKHYSLQGNLHETSYLRIEEPVSFEMKHVIKICDVDATQYQPLNSSVCALMCSDKYIYHQLLSNEEKFGGFYFNLGNLCCCENYGCNTANEIKLLGPSCIINNCIKNGIEFDTIQAEQRLYETENYIEELEMQYKSIENGELINYNCSIKEIQLEIQSSISLRESLKIELGLC